MSRYASKVGHDSPQYHAAASFFDWIDEIHRINYARSLEARPSIFGNNLDDFAVLQSAAQQDSIQDTVAPVDTLSTTISIPSVRRLLRWPPDKLLEVRDFGLDWRASAHRFLDSPSDSSRHQAERALDEYARRLRSLSPASPYTNLTVRAFALKAAPTLLTAASGLALPEYGAYVATVGTTGYLAYQYLYKGMRQKVRIDLRANVIAAK